MTQILVNLVSSYKSLELEMFITKILSDNKTVIMQLAKFWQGKTLASLAELMLIFLPSQFLDLPIAKC